MPHHIVEAVKEQLAGKTKLSVPVHEVLSIDLMRIRPSD